MIGSNLRLSIKFIILMRKGSGLARLQLKLAGSDCGDADPKRIKNQEIVMLICAFAGCRNRLQRCRANIFRLEQTILIMSSLGVIKDGARYLSL